MRDAAGRKDAHVDGIDTDTVESCLKGGRQHLTGPPRISTDDYRTVRQSLAGGAA
jgi:hypothetical protein